AYTFRAGMAGPAPCQGLESRGIMGQSRCGGAALRGSQRGGRRASLAFDACRFRLGLPHSEARTPEAGSRFGGRPVKCVKCETTLPPYFHSTSARSIPRTERVVPPRGTA